MEKLPLDKRLELRSLLGKVRDIILAEKFGISREYVRQMRVQFGIPTYHDAKIKGLLKEITPLLGKIPDKEIAAKFNITILDVAILRKNKNIRKFRKKTRMDGLPKEVLKLIGKETDYKIEKTFGLSRNTICYYRQQHNIPAVGNAPVKRHQYTKIQRKHIKLMGTMPDTELAKKFQLNKLVILKYRHRLGIPKYTPHKVVTPEVLKYIEEKCGTVSDAKLAAEVGVSAEKVFKIRRKLNKPSWKEVYLASVNKDM